MNKLFAIYIILQSLLVVSFAFNNEHTITVSGEGHVSVLPDECSISFGVEIFNVLLEYAHKQSEKQSQQLLAVIKEMGIQDQFISTDHVRLSIERDSKDGSHNSKEVIGFTVKKAFTAILHDLTLVEKFVSNIMKNGANEIHSIHFRSSKAKELRDQARISAVRAAKAKAELYAHELGVRVGKPLQINEGEASFHLQSRGLERAHVGGGAWDSFGTPSYEGTVPIGNIDISASVHVVFSIDSSDFRPSSSNPSDSRPSSNSHTADPLAHSAYPSRSASSHPTGKCAGENNNNDDIQSSLLP